MKTTEQIVAEIKVRIQRLKEIQKTVVSDKDIEMYQGKIETLTMLLSFICAPSLEPEDKDLATVAREKALMRFSPVGGLQDCFWKQRAGYTLGFVDGANLIKEQMMKDAIDTTIDGDNVKLIILKDE